MNEEERMIINTYLYKLNSEIQCEAILSIFVSKDILHDTDVQNIRTKQTPMAQVSELLRILQTRVDGFSRLIEALELTKQTGALKLLRGSSTAKNDTMTASSQSSSSSSYRDYVVGSKKCKIGVVVSILESSSVAYEMAAWHKLARVLETPEVVCTDLREKLHSGELQTVWHVFTQLLNDWKMRDGDDATLGELIDILRGLNWNTFAVELEGKFGGT